LPADIDQPSQLAGPLDPSQYDAVLVLSFGGPEAPDEVMPFLRRVTSGRGVPDERLAAVAEHYYHFGGVSPINGHNRDLVAAVRTALDARGIALPVYWGNRNWHPLVSDTVAEMAASGVKRALVFATSATGSYSGCRQYRENLADSRAEYEAKCGRSAPELVKLRHYFDHPGFIAANVDAVRDALLRLPAEQRDHARLVFTAHSIPVWMNESAGPAGGLYAAQHVETARLVSAAIRGPDAEFDLVWQSRSGPPSVPWLEPDVNDHLRTLAASGTQAVVVSPTGFVSDHLEVGWDLDVEAAQTAQELGLWFERAASAGTHPAFVSMIVELIEEQVAGRPPRSLSPLGICGRDCAAWCCPGRRSAA
jgi:protoporphyrin/coproporphyrin ferrochelatase